MIKKTALTTLFFFLFSVSAAHAAAFKTAGFSFNKDVKPLNVVKKNHVVSQSLDFSCGAAGLSTLLTFHLNDNVPEEEIISSLLEIVPLEKVKARQGFSLLDLKRFAEAKGYKVTGYKMDINFLSELDKPVLVPIKYKNYRHFVIVKDIVANRVFIADPAAGNMTMKVDKFQKMWPNGIGLVIEHPEERAQDYALKVENDDLSIMNYTSLQGLVARNAFRTQIFANEF